MQHPRLPLRALRHILLAALCVVGLPVVAGAQECNLTRKSLVCQEVEVKGKVWVDGEESKVKCVADASNQLFMRLTSGDLSAAVRLADTGESCQALATYVALAGEEPDERIIPLVGVGAPEQKAKNGTPRKECLVQATEDTEADVAFLASLQGSWKFDGKTGQPTVLKGDLVAQHVSDATGISGRFIGQLKAKDCFVGSLL